ncbi:MAG TPA: polysaccharide lyase family 8 super-sandwich domain-containing protein [Niabella sp.]|nr:polysaccharide lyase family 8 super-sandwich domain-containing protein [Niabella sp.]
MFKDILQTDKTKKEALNIIADRVTGKKSASFDVKPLHIYFWKGDYTLHVRPKYSFNVRTVSKRTVRTESGNKENLLGTVLPDGSVNLVRRGNEYLNIMPVWEWDKIPGVTARDYDTAVILKKQWGEYGSTDFVGGVTDSLYGATVYEQDYDNVKVKKAYFFFDNEIVCLGAGIKSNAPQNITTTINQAWNNGKVLTSSNNKTFQLKKQSEFSDLNWVWHDSIGYYFPKPQNVFVSSQQQSGSWTSINGNQKGTEKGMVFKMWIDHGRNPVSASYEYIVVPGISEKEASSNNIDGTAILSNNESLQAVAQKDLKIIQAVFYTPGELSWQGIKIKADKPCILQIRDFDKSTVKLSIADPAQKLEDVTITINTPELKEKKLTIGLPKAPYGGQSVALEIK